MVQTHIVDNTSSAVSAGCESERSAAEESAAKLEWRVQTAFDGLESSRRTWDEAVVRLGGNIYVTYDWLQTWWQFYGQGKQLRLFVFSFADEIVALLPLYVESFKLGLICTTAARFVGANIPPKTFDPPVDPAFAVEVFARVLKHLFVEDRCDLLSLGPVSQTWRSADAFPKACAEARELVSPPVYVRRDVQTVFQLPRRFDEYLASLGSTERKNRLKRIRHLEKSHRVSSDIVAAPEMVEKAFGAFTEQHGRQWQAAGKAGHFRAWPYGEDYNRALVKAQGKQGRVRFYRMLVDGQVVASRYTFMLGKTIYSELPARETGEPWDRLGIGGISLIKFIESAIQSEMACVDSGLGSYEHKAHLGGDEIAVGTWQVQARGLSGVKARLFCLIAKVILFACRKLWYRRVLPKVRRHFEQTQALWWLRFDV